MKLQIKNDKKYFARVAQTFFALAAAIAFSGCFAHKEAPERLVSAKGAAEGEARAAELESLDLSGAGETSLPASLATMPRLRVLYLRGGAFTDFSALAGAKSLEVLDLARVKFDELPQEVLSLSALRDLYLSGCGLRAFPQRLDSLPALRYLNLDRNAIDSLPDTLPTHLRWLRLNHNSIKTLPESVGALASLERLYLRGNGLTAIPDALSRCTAVTDLDLASNDLDSFPTVLASLPKLRNLDLSGNKRIAAMPDDTTLAKMSALRTLKLTGCPLANDERERVRAALPDSCAIIF